jgi:CDP-diacylglycerol--glycerol-3-phosphate 3-phosphatidyltransferase
MEKTQSRWLLVTALTGSRLILAAGIGGLAVWSEAQAWAVVASLVLLGLSELTDALDGFLARRWGAVSDFGKMFDPYCDSVSRLIIYWALAVTGRAWVAVPLVMAVRDVTVSYSRIIMTRRGIDVSARLTGKLKALVQGLCAPVLFATFWMAQGPADTVIALASSLVILITLMSMVDYVRAALCAPAVAAPAEDE